MTHDVRDDRGRPYTPRHPMIVCGSLRARVDYLLTLARALNSGPELEQLNAIVGLLHELEWSLMDESWIGKEP